MRARVKAARDGKDGRPRSPAGWGWLFQPRDVNRAIAMVVEKRSCAKNACAALTAGDWESVCVPSTVSTTTVAKTIHPSLRNQAVVFSRHNQIARPAARMHTAPATMV